MSSYNSDSLPNTINVSVQAKTITPKGSFVYKGSTVNYTIQISTNNGNLSCSIINNNQGRFDIFLSTKIRHLYPYLAKAGIAALEMPYNEIRIKEFLTKIADHEFKNRASVINIENYINDIWALLTIYLTTCLIPELISCLFAFILCLWRVENERHVFAAKSRNTYTVCDNNLDHFTEDENNKIKINEFQVGQSTLIKSIFIESDRNVKTIYDIKWKEIAYSFEIIHQHYINIL